MLTIMYIQFTEKETQEKEAEKEEKPEETPTQKLIAELKELSTHSNEAKV